MNYCTVEDLTCRFGEHHILGLADKACKKDKDLSADAVQKLIKLKIQDAEAELNLALSCCYDLCELNQWIADGYEFDILKHWTADIAHKHLSDCARPNGTRIQEEYLDYEKEVEKICPGMGKLLAYKRDEDGITTECKAFPKMCMGGAIVAFDNPTCLPKNICRCKGKCGCGC